MRTCVGVCCVGSEAERQRGRCFCLFVTQCNCKTRISHRGMWARGPCHGGQHNSLPVALLPFPFIFAAFFFFFFVFFGLCEVQQVALFVVRVDLGELVRHRELPSVILAALQHITMKNATDNPSSCEPKPSSWSNKSAALKSRPSTRNRISVGSMKSADHGTAGLKAEAASCANW